MGSLRRGAPGPLGSFRRRRRGPSSGRADEGPEPAGTPRDPVAMVSASVRAGVSPGRLAPRHPGDCDGARGPGATGDRWVEVRRGHRHPRGSAQGGTAGADPIARPPLDKIVSRAGSSHKIPGWAGRRTAPARRHSGMRGRAGAPTDSVNQAVGTLRPPLPESGERAGVRSLGVRRRALRIIGSPLSRASPTRSPEDGGAGRPLGPIGHPLPESPGAPVASHWLDTPTSVLYFYPYRIAQDGR
jgi:hypothetical protein